LFRIHTEFCKFMFAIVTVFALFVAYSSAHVLMMAPMRLFPHKTKQAMHTNRTFSTMQTTQQNIEGN